MKKPLIIILILCLAFTGCERDIICIDDTTPFLVLTFNDYENQGAAKTLEIDSIKIKGLQPYITDQKLDSLAIPLDLNENFTNYQIWSDGVLDEMKVTYERKDIYVGRSCGYKTIFENFELESNTTNWIKSIEINNTTIDNDTTSAITIFH